VYTGISGGRTGHSAKQAVIYPNPADDHFIIGLSMPAVGVTLTLTNSRGRTVRIIENINGTSLRIKRGNLPPGIYFYQIATGDTEVAGGKLILR
jgi:hypothetical protein